MTTTLAIETSTDACCIGLRHQDRLASRVIVEARVHARVLMPEIRGALEELDCQLSDIGRIAFGKGPGSFTGVRIAVALAQGIASGLNVPVSGISSLRVIAQSAFNADPSVDRISVLQDARLGEVYFGNYQLDDAGLAMPLAPDALLTPEQAAKQLLSTATGSALDVFERLKSAVVSANVRSLPGVLPDPLALLMLAERADVAWSRASEGQALYLRDKVAQKMSERG